MRAVAGEIKKKGFTVSLIDYQDIGNGMIRYFNKQEYNEPNQPPLQTPGGDTQAAGAPVAPPPGAAGR
jgi:hypothetical protein